jgi:hypothetical protein
MKIIHAGDATDIVIREYRGCRDPKTLRNRVFCLQLVECGCVGAAIFPRRGPRFVLDLCFSLLTYVAPHRKTKQMLGIYRGFVSLAL